MVIKVISLGSPEYRDDPEVRTAIEEERQNVLGKRVWIKGEERELSWMRKNRPNAKIVRAHLVGAIKNIQDRQQRKVKIRVVANGGKAVDVRGDRFAVYDLLCAPYDTRVVPHAARERHDAYGSHD